MQILHYSDRAIESFDDLYDSCDLLISTGDLSNFDFGTLSERADKKPAFGVYGNHDSGLYLENLGILNLHNKVFEWNGLKWGGFQGCLKYKEKAIQFTEEEARVFCDTFPYVDVLILHAGPKDMLDDPSDPVHLGSESIARYVIEKKPKFVFLGHQYSNGYLDNGETKLYRTYGGQLLDIPL